MYSYTCEWIWRYMYVLGENEPWALLYISECSFFVKLVDWWWLYKICESSKMPYPAIVARLIGFLLLTNTLTLSVIQVQTSHDAFPVDDQSEVATHNRTYRQTDHPYTYLTRYRYPDRSSVELDVSWYYKYSDDFDVSDWLTAEVIMITYFQEASFQ